MKKLLAVVAVLALVAVWVASLLGSGAAGAAPTSHARVQATTSVAVAANDRLRPGMRLILPRTYHHHRVRHYQWLRCNRFGKRCHAIRGATRHIYTVRMIDVGHTLRAHITPWQGSTTVVTTATPQVGRPLPVNTTLPAITDGGQGGGTLSGPIAGDVLAGSDGTWQHAVRFTYQWFDCAPSGTTPPTTWTNPVTLDGLTCSAIAGATTSSYTLQDPGDVGFDIVFQVTAYNS